MRITIGIDISKDTLDAYQLPDNQHIQVANDQTGHKTLVRWIGKYDLPLVVFEATGAYSVASWLACFLACLMSAETTVFVSLLVTFANIR